MPTKKINRKGACVTDAEGVSEIYRQIAEYLDRYDGKLRAGQLPVQRYNEQSIKYRLTRIANAAGVDLKVPGKSSRDIFMESVRALESGGAEIDIKIRRLIAWFVTESYRQSEREKEAQQTTPPAVPQ